MTDPKEPKHPPRKPRLTAKVMAGLTAAIVSHECKLSATWSDRDWEEYRSAKAWLLNMSRYRVIIKEPRP